MKNLTVENNRIYKIPTDEDAKERPDVEARDHEDERWSAARLMAVLDSLFDFQFLVFSNGVTGRRRYCRLDTGIDIPDGWRLVDTEKESFDKRAKYWSACDKEWIKTVNTAWDKSLVYVVPAEKARPKYRPFESFEEWWPYRERWVRNENEYIGRVCWCGEAAAKRSFNGGAVFLNDDGTPGEPFGVRVE